MSIRIVLLFLIIMVLLGLFSGPKLRKFLLKLLGISRRDR